MVAFCYDDDGKFELRRRQLIEFANGRVECGFDGGEFDASDGRVLRVADTVTVVKNVLWQGILVVRVPVFDTFQNHVL